MIGRILVLVLTVFVFNLATPAMAAETGSGIVDGQVSNGTEGGSSVADIEVILTTYLNGNEVASATCQTDSDGRFSFADLVTDSAHDYEVKITYQEADYYSERLSFGEGETTKSTSITVFNATTSSEAIKVATSHTVVYLDEGSLLVTEYLLFTNDSDRTYIGLPGNISDEIKQTLQFSLPAKATELQPSTGLMQCCIYLVEGGFIDSMPVLPGNKELVYSYRVSYTSGEYAFSQKVNYPVADYNLLVQGEGTGVTSDRLTSEGPLDIQGMYFQHLSGGGLLPGDVVVAQFSALPASSSQSSFVWVTLVLVMLAGGTAAVYLRKGRRLQPVRVREDKNQIQQRLLAELARLDDSFEDGQIDEESYRKQRDQAKAKLVELARQSER